MNSMQRINAKGQNQHGDAYLDYLTDTEELTAELKAARDRALGRDPTAAAVGYYHDDSESETQRWAGKLAQELGLRGKKVDKAAMIALAKGFDPRDGSPLCKNAGEQPHTVVKTDRQGNPRLDKDGNPMTREVGGHRVGFDMTTTPPKSVSLLFAIAEGDDKYAVLEAHRQAVAKMLTYLEDKVETRRGAQGRDVIGTKGLIIMQADHVTNRDLAPNIHTHNLIFGVAQGEDGKWGTFDAHELYRHRMAADQVYKCELAMNLRELGYGIEQQRILNDDGKETGMVSFEVAGFSQNIIDTFSTRRSDILAYEQEHGVDRQTACLATRKHKDEPAPEEMERMWKDTMVALEQSTPGLVPTIAGLRQLSDRDMRQDTPDVILERLHENEAVICDHDLIHRLGQEHMGKVRLEELQSMAEEFKTSQGLVKIHAAKIADEDRGNSLARVHSETRYAAPWMVQWESEVIHRVKSRENEDHQRLQPHVVQQAIESYQQRKGFILSDEQRGAVEHIVQGTGGVAILSGMAGTGKTTVSDCYSEAFKADGRNMLGVCVSNAAARKLESESGMLCRSVAKTLSMLDLGSLTLNEQDVLVIDEAGMIDTNSTRRLLAHAQNALCKVVVQGDVMQLQPIGAGSGMSLAKMAVDDFQLTENRRQAHVEDRAIAQAFYQRDESGRMVELTKGTRSRAETTQIGQTILSMLMARGAIDEFGTTEQAMDGIAQDYLACTTPMDEKLVLASQRAEVNALNAKIRAGLKAAGQLPEDEISFKAIENSNAFILNLARGDRVRFTKNDLDGLGVTNGEAGVAERIRMNEAGGFDIAVRMENIDGKGSRLVEFNTRNWNAITHNYASTVHKAQGQGKTEVFHLASMGMLDNHSSLVAFTRLTKGDYRLYGDDETIERLKERFGLERLKGNAITEGIQRGQGNGLEQLVDAHAKRTEHHQKVQEHSALTEEDVRWFQDAVATMARGTREEPLPEHTQEKGRSRGRGR